MNGRRKKERKGKGRGGMEIGGFDSLAKGGTYLHRPVHIASKPYIHIHRRHLLHFSARKRLILILPSHGG